MKSEKYLLYKKTKGELAASTLMIFLSIIIITAAVLAVFITRVDEFSSTGYATSGQIKRTISQDSQIIQVMGYDGSNGYYDELRIDLRLGVNSFELDLYETPVTIRSGNWSIFLEYRNGNPV